MISSEDLSSESVTSFTSASFHPLLKQCYRYVYESTLTLQRISSVLTDGDDLSRENEQIDEEESGDPSSVSIFPGCPDLGPAPGGPTDSFSLHKDVLDLLALPAEGKLCDEVHLHFKL